MILNFLQGVILLFTAMWLWRRIQRKTPPPLPTSKTIQDVNYKLNDDIVMTALKREQRAKAALCAVLETQGLSLKQIEDILVSIDRED